MCKLGFMEMFHLSHCRKPLINTPHWSLLEIPKSFCLSLQPSSLYISQYMHIIC